MLLHNSEPRSCIVLRAAHAPGTSIAHRRVPYARVVAEADGGYALYSCSCSARVAAPKPEMALPVL